MKYLKFFTNLVLQLILINFSQFKFIFSAKFKLKIKTKNKLLNKLEIKIFRKQT